MGSCMSSLSADQPRNHNLTKWCNIMLNKNKKRRRSRNGSKSKSKRGLFSRFGVSTDLSKVQSGIAVSDGCYDENLLHRLSDRLFLNGASENACLFTQQGRKGTNQDAMLVWENFASKEDTIFCGVFDGHGPYGHMVAKKVRDSLPLKLLDKWELCTNDDDALVNDDNVSSNSEETASINNVEDWHEPVDGVEDGENLQERKQWAEAENKWSSACEELKHDLEKIRALADKQKIELASEKNCLEELKEALRTAMHGHAQMLDQYADLQEKHIALLSRHRKLRNGISDVRKAAARAGVKGAELKFIDSLAAEISALKTEREKERQLWRNENKELQVQLRDTVEAVQTAGKLLVRLKEAEESSDALQKRTAAAEKEVDEAYGEIDRLKRP